MLRYTRSLVILYLLSIYEIGKCDDYYELLGVSKDADNREIRRAFKKLALKLHPDKNKDDQDSHERFIKVNKAYEVLKDEETRKKYDLHGEEGLKDDFGSGWQGNFRSWNYYYESFGIYDDDPEIITLSRSDFEQSVTGARATWFINFYSPQCSHCHHLAPAWRALARELEGVIRIGAVNCEEDWMLCRQQNIHSYPSLMMYPQQSKYRGLRDADSMVDYVLQQLPNLVIEFTGHDFQELISREEYKVHPWLISVCREDEECLPSEALRKLSLILEGLVNVAKVEYEQDRTICDKLNCSSLITFYSNLSSLAETVTVHQIKETEVKPILNEVLLLLPGATEMIEEMFQNMRKDVDSLSYKPWLIHFTKPDTKESGGNMETELKKLRALLPGIEVGQVNCQALATVCSLMYVRKYPTFIVFKTGGAHEFHYGRLTAHDIASFVRQSLSSRVEALGPQDFPGKVIESKDTWFVDFFAPWCPPCMQLLPEYRKVSRSMGHLVRFGTVDCTMHDSLCAKYKIRSYPTTVLYNQTVPHHYHGSHTAGGLEDFIQDTLNPPVIFLTPESFENMVALKTEDEIWVIDFFAPWCGPCQQLAPQWSKLARMFSEEPNVHIGSVDCQQYHELCSSQGVNTYPNIRLYPRGSSGISRFSSYNGWNRDAASLRAWVYSFFPSTVADLSRTDFYKKLLIDSEPWVIDFYAPWCGHCQMFAPEFEHIAKALVGKAKAGKVNCVELPDICQKAGVNAYPTVLYYAGSQDGQSQHPVGEELYTTNADSIISFIVKQVRSQKKTQEHDEL